MNCAATASKFASPKLKLKAQAPLNSGSRRRPGARNLESNPIYWHLDNYPRTQLLHPHKTKMAAPLSHVPPTTAAYVIATAIIAGVTGYFIGQGASLGLFREKQGWPNGYDVKVHKDSSDEEADGEDSEDESDEEDEGNGEELASFKDNEEEVKLVLVVRTDLGMTKGMCSTRRF